MKSKGAYVLGSLFQFLCLLLLFFTPLFSDEEIRFEKVTMEQGLSQSVVLCILQDKHGFMWFGTQDGLNRYDGYEMLVFQHQAEEPESLGDNFIQTLYEDDEGYIWIGMRTSGLDRLDPRDGKFRHFVSDPENPETLSFNHVTAIQEDADGFLWIGTRGGGINRFDKKNGTFFRFTHNPKDPQSLCHDDIRDLYVDKHNRLWIGTEGGGLDLYDPEKNAFLHIGREKNSSGFDASIVIALAEDKSGRILAGTDRGLYLIEDNSASGESFLVKNFQHIPGDPQSLSHNVVFGILCDKEEFVWIGTYGGGLNRISSEHLEQDLSRFENFRHERNTPSSLSHDIILSLFEDRSGLLWVGTSGGGLNKAMRNRKSFIHLKSEPDDRNDLNHNFIFSVFEDRDRTLWVGTREGLCFRSPGMSDYFYLFEGRRPSDILKHNIIRDVIQDKSGFLWICTYSAGLLKLNKATGDLKRFKFQEEQPDSISHARLLTLLEDSTGNIWIGTEQGGLNVLSYPETGKDIPKFNHFRHDSEDPGSLSSDYVLSICEARDRAIWVGTYGGGLNRLSVENRKTSSGRFIRYTHNPEDPSSLSSDQILAVSQSKNGTLWVGTAGGGLNRLNEDQKTFRRYKEKEGLANDTVYGILEDSKEKLWLSTNNGLTRFDPQTEEFINFDVYDGLQGAEFNRGAFFQNQAGRMYFGGINGITAFHPEDIEIRTYEAPLVITDIQIFGKNLAGEGADFDLYSEEPGPTVVLSPLRSIVKLSFVSLDFANPSKNKYAYKLEGRDLDWIDLSGQKVLTLSGLKKGNYTLKIRGSNSDGVWNDMGASLSVKVIPSLWGRTWFIAVLIVLVISAAVLIYRLIKKLSRSSLQKEIDIESILPVYNISKREQEILKLLLKGSSNRDIGKELYISESTVKKHVHSIYQKLGVKNRLQIISLLQKSGSE